jgi:hypothetical protein
MANEADIANDLVEHNLQESLKKAKEDLAVLNGIPKGICRNCDSAISDLLYFCDRDCVQDFEYRTQLQSRQAG